MAKKNLNIKVDTINSLNKPEGIIKQLDSVFFNVEITEAGEKKDLTSQQVKLFARKSDGKIVEQTTGISITDATNGQLTIDLLNAAVQVPGYVYFELEISDNGGTISTANFIYKVISKVGSDEAIESTNEVATLKKIEEYVSQAKVELQNFKKLQTAMLETNNSLNSQEELRVEAESLRITAEEGRVAAETKREEAFNKIEGRITANTEELKDARTATTGETFDSIDERIDCEVNRINKKIEISFLEQEDSGSHTVENTVEGMTKDIIIKGRTLKNLCDTTVRVSSGSVYINNNNNKFFFKSGDYTLKNTSGKVLYCNIYSKSANTKVRERRYTTTEKITLNDDEYVQNVIGNFDANWANSSEDKELLKQQCVIVAGDYTNNSLCYFENIKSFGEQEGKIIEFIRGKNLCDNSKNANTEISYSNGSESSNTKIVTTSYINISDIKQFTTSSNKGNVTVRWYDINKKYLGGDERPNNAHFIRLRYLSTSNISPSEVLFQLEIGIEKTNYAEYAENKKEIKLSKYGFDEGLRGFNLKSCDELNSIRNVAIKRIDKYIFSGDEKMVLSNIQSDGFLTVKITKTGVKNESDLICNNFANNKEVWDQKTLTEGIQALNYEAGSLFFIKIDKKKLNGIETIEGFKQWLKENETVVYYELAEPVETPLDENITLKTFLEKTYVVFENSLKGTSSFKAPVNAVATISRLNRENKALEEENLKLKENMIETSKSLIEVDTNIIATNWDIDYRVCEIEWTLEDMGGSSPVNFKLLKKGAGNMALSRYEQAKIMILGGAYEKETLTRQLDAYLKRKYVSQEEYDELIALMEARDMVTNQ